MRDKIIEYIKEQKEKLVSGEIDVISLKGVCPAYIEDVFGDFEDSLDLNGWQGDYWANTEDGFHVSGCMYYGTAKISLEEE